MAVEMIGDELTLICLQLERLGDRFCEPVADLAVPSTAEVSTDVPTGIVHSVLNQFAVGPFKYTQLEDAVTELRRVKKVGGDEAIG